MAPNLLFVIVQTRSKRLGSMTCHKIYDRYESIFSSRNCTFFFSDCTFRCIHTYIVFVLAFKSFYSVYCQPNLQLQEVLGKEKIKHSIRRRKGRVDVDEMLIINREWLIFVFAKVIILHLQRRYLWNVFISSIVPLHNAQLCNHVLVTFCTQRVLEA